MNIKSHFCYNVALGNVNNSFENFYISSDNGDSSLIEPENYSAIVSVNLVRADEFKQFLNDLDSLDNFQSRTTSLSEYMNFDSGKERLIDLIKLEAEGAELADLQGFEKLFYRTRYVSADLGFENKGQSTLPEVTNYLLAKGFEIVNIGSPRLTALFKNSSL